MKKKSSKNVIKRILSVVLGVLLVLGVSAPVAAEVDLNATFAVDSDYWEYWPEAGWISGVTGVLMDADTGTILYSKGLDAQRYPASITKIMTALVVLENCSLDEQVVMTETGMADAYSGSSNVIPTLGEVFTVEQCLEMLLVKSANDIASQLAEHTAGSVAAFADMMNARAASLGCTNTHFVNASGLEDENHYTSARDMALIMQAAIQNEVFRSILQMQSVEIPATNTSGPRYYNTHVYLMQPDSNFYYSGCLGGKTGYTPISASTLVCYAQRDGMTLIGVVLGAPETESNANDMITLFNYGFANFHRENAVHDVECVGGGGLVTLPDGISADMLQYQASVDGDNVNLTYYISDHRIGSCTMTRANFDVLHSRLGDVIEGAPELLAENPQETETQQTVSGSSGTGQENRPAETVPEPEPETDSGEPARESDKSVLYVIIVVLGVVFLICVLFLSWRAKNIRKRKKKAKKKKRSCGGKK